jgi:hypothetical protein
MKSAARQWLVTVAALGDLTMSTKSGGEKTAEAARWRDGGSLTADIVTSPPETGDVTVTRAFDPTLDAEVIHNLKRQIGLLRTTLTCQPLLPDMSRAPVKPDVYPNAVLIGVNPPEFDANSGDVATYELTFAPGDLT